MLDMAVRGNRLAPVKKRRRNILVTGAVIALALAAPLGARAGSVGPTVSLGTAGAYEYFKATFTDVDAQAGAPADCGAAQNVIGGGGSVSGKPAAAALNRTSPTSTQGVAWVAEGRPLGGGTRNVTSYSICSPAANAFSNGTSGIDPGGTTTLSDACVLGDELFGLGIQGSGGDVRLLESSFPTLDSAHSTGQNVGDSAADLTEWYACIADYTQVLRSNQTFVASHDSAKSTARCQDGEAVIFGGFASTVNGNPARKTWVTASRPYDSKDAGKTPEDGWSVKAQNNRKGKSLLSAYAVCVPLAA
jgi:hypothetical protein